MAKKMKSRQFGTLLRGGTRSKLRQNMSKKQYQRLVKTARRRGLTVEGLVSNAPNPLKERSRKGLRREASRTMARAYKPLDVELNQAESRTRALDDKRRLDNERWRNWLAGESSKMMAAQRTADESLRSSQAAIQEDIQNVWNSAKQEAQQSVQQQTGYTSNPQQGSAFDFGPEQMRDVQKIASERTRSNEILGAGQTQLARTSANNFAFMAAIDAKRVADTWNSLKDIGDDKQKVKFQRAADTAKEVSRLLDQEIEKAGLNREFSAALQKLGIDAAELRLDKVKANRDYRIKKGELRRKITNDQVDARLKRIDQQLAREGLTEKQRHNLVTEQQDLQEIRRKRRKDKLAAKGGGLTHSEVRSYRDKYDSLRNDKAGLYRLENNPPHALMLRAINEARGKGLTSKTIREFKNRYGFTPKGKRRG